MVCRWINLMRQLTRLQNTVLEASSGQWELSVSHGAQWLTYRIRAIRSEVHKVNARVNNIAPGFFLTPLTKKNHGIQSPDQPSKLLGAVLPWARLEHVVETAGRCAVDDSVNGKHRYSL